MNRTDPSREKNYLLLGTLILMPMGSSPAMTDDKKDP
jgi:hypothetical protein